MTETQGINASASDVDRRACTRRLGLHTNHSLTRMKNDWVVPFNSSTREFPLLKPFHQEVKSRLDWTDSECAGGVGLGPGAVPDACAVVATFGVALAMPRDKN